MEMTNAEWMIKNGHKFSELDVKCLGLGRGCRIAINGKTVEKVPLVNMASAIICWLDEEHIDPILDDAEKRYLAGVIRPFRDRVTSICKSKSITSNREFLTIRVSKYDLCGLPWFEGGTMYKGMERDKEYTLEELGL